MRPGDSPGKEATEEAVFPPVLPVLVRPMEVVDIQAVMDIERSSFPSPWPESAYHYELRYRSDSLFYVLQDRGGGSPILGYFGLRIGGYRAHVRTIAIHPDWRGQGLGKFLLLVALEKAIRRGVRRVTLEVRPSNSVAQRLYADLGFVRETIRPAYYRDEEDAWVMSLGPLDGADMARLRGLRRAAEARLVKGLSVCTGR
ncbi:MAG: ribosomal protein S18-alanine N-acetyltransferase [Anaerolineae bacterium]